MFRRKILQISIYIAEKSLLRLLIINFFRPNVFCAYFAVEYRRVKNRKKKKEPADNLGSVSLPSKSCISCFYGITVTIKKNNEIVF